MRSLARNMGSSWLFALLLAASSLTGCASAKYHRVRTGQIGGVVTIEWIGSDKFVYRPDPKRPFYFRRANGELIQPGPIFTDGGSIPKPLWSIRGYSPWGFGPAYIAHDWLFSAHHCHLPQATGHTVFTAADVLSECIKTLMEENPNVLKSASLLYTIDGAVRSPIAQNLWNKGDCTVPPEELPSVARGRVPFSMRRLTSGRSGWVETFDLDALPKR